MITKKCLVSFVAFATTLLLSLAFVCVMSLFSVSKWIGVSVGAGIFFIMLVTTLIFFKHKIVYYISIIINSVASGITMSSLFVHSGEYPSILHVVIIFISFCALFYLYCVLARIPFVTRHYIIFMILYCSLIIAGGSVVGIFCGKTILFTIIVSFIQFLSYYITLGVHAKNFEKNIRNCAFASFSALIVVIIVVLFIISKGEFLDGFAPDVETPNNRKNRNPYKYIG